MTIADRDDVVVFAATARVTDPLLLPEVGDTVAHAWFDDADHVVFDVTCAVVFAADDDGTDHEVLSTINVGATLVPGCVTVTVHVT